LPSWLMKDAGISPSSLGRRSGHRWTFQPCFLAVEKRDRMSAKSIAPSTERKPPEIFCWGAHSSALFQVEKSCVFKRKGELGRERTLAWFQGTAALYSGAESRNRSPCNPECDSSGTPSTSILTT
jgi:hypothetical protein